MTYKVYFKKRRLPAHKVADEDDVKAEIVCRAEQCGSRVVLRHLACWKTTFLEKDFIGVTIVSAEAAFRPCIE